MTKGKIGRPKTVEEVICSVEGCGRMGRTGASNGHCAPHHRRFLKTGSLREDFPIGGRTPAGGECTVDGCSGVIRCSGLCAFHYSRLKDSPHVPLDSPSQKVYQRKICDFEGCERRSNTRSLCSYHYKQWLANEELTPVTRPKGSYTTPSGYVMLNMQGRKVPEHRWVMENILNRSLNRGENVHHINGVKNDNRPENLELWVVSQPPGQRAIDFLDWARTIIVKYGPIEEILRPEKTHGYSR